MIGGCWELLYVPRIGLLPLLTARADTGDQLVCIMMSTLDFTGLSLVFG